MQVAPANSSITAGQTQQFQATGIFSDGTAKNLTASASWAVSSTAIAIVGPTGLATGMGQGIASVSASVGSVTASASLRVAALQSLQVTPATATVAVGHAQQFAATGIYSDGTTRDLTAACNWLSSSSHVAGVTVSGLATGLAPGTSRISASMGKLQAAAVLTVSPAPLVVISITPLTATLPPGGTQPFTATGTYADGSSRDVTASVLWSATTGATISAGGVATAISPGTSTIAATLGGVSGSAALTVNNPVVTIAVTPINPSVHAGTSVAFTATATYFDHTTAVITAGVAWSSSDSSIAIVSDIVPTKGLATFRKAGSCTITASSGGIYGTTTATVSPASLASISLTPATSALSLGLQQQFTATGTYTDATTQDITNSVIWSSDHPEFASITNSGLATGVGVGTATITATQGTISGFTSLTANAANVKSIALTPGNPSIAQGTSQSLTAIATLDNGSTLNITSQARWSSSDTLIATVGAHSGVAKGWKPGSVVLTATLGSTSNAATLTVTGAAIAAITVTPQNQTLAPRTRLGFTATGVFSDATSQVITGDCGWSSDDPAAAAMSASTATAVAQGTANIAASFSFAGASAAGSAPVAVSAATLTSLSIFPASALLAPSTTQAFSATGTFSDGTLQSVNGLANWTSSDPSVVSIKASGVATGQSAGTATITAAYPALGLTSNPADLLVEATQLQAIAMTPLAATVPATISTAFIATGAFADGSRQNLTAFVTWASSDGSRSTISNSSGQHGIATGMAPGTARLTAVFDGQVGSASLAVTDATLLSISVTPANPSIPLGQSQAFLATGRFSDGTTLNLSLSQPTWISSDLSVAVISPSGLATSAGRGTSMITVSVNGVRGASVLTVH